jgi:short-subunit dehydrogenase
MNDHSPRSASGSPTALVTGASSGIGLELARLLARDGYEVVLAARSARRLEELAVELGSARVVAVDLATPGGAAELADAVSRVDVLVNNAGFGDFGPFAEASLDKALDMIQLNVTTLTELTRRYLPGMLERRAGRVMNVASTAAFQPGPLMAVYYATKAYVLSFTEAVAEEVRGSGVTLTALCPGPTASGFQAGAEMESSKLVRGKRLPAAAEVAEVGYRAMLAGDPVKVVGLRNQVMAASIRFTPRPVARRVVHRMQQPS